jgi:type II secretory pathway predicted ATPase ExeA
MYETYFNLTERPFASVPRIDHYYPAAVIDAARNTLTRCLDRGEGVGMIVGPSGTGKSLLCQVLARQFQKTLQVALLASTHLDTRRSLLQAILYELNRPYRGMDEGELRLTLVDYITLSDDCSRGIVLLVDEAHHLPLRLLDEIRSLTNLTRDMQPAVRMVLAGSHVLEERFASPKLESFSQRISARCYLEAFQRSETQSYIQNHLSACGGRGAEIFPAETCQMVHKATDGVPRLINQVCDHVMLLAYAAGIRRIEPAHVEEAWADLQQLPTPWNAPAPPTGNSLIEFGGLDDAPAEMPPIAGRVPAAEEATLAEGTSSAEAPMLQPTLVAETSEDPESFEQLRHIQQLLADVQAEFQPVATIGPEVELVFETPHPFAEPFEEEEVINDRYAAVAPPPAPSGLAVEPAPAAVAAAAAPDNMAELEGASESRQELQPETVPLRKDQPRAPSTLGRTDVPQPATIPMPHDREVTWNDGLDAEVAVATVATVGGEPSPRPTRAVVPPPRQEFGRLFAKLRRGL